MMIYIFWGFFLGAVIGAAISNVLTSHYDEKVIDEWRLLYHKCRGEMDRLYKQKDELYEKFKEAK